MGGRGYGYGSGYGRWRGCERDQLTNELMGWARTHHTRTTTYESTRLTHPSNSHILINTERPRHPETVACSPAIRSQSSLLLSCPTSSHQPNLCPAIVALVTSHPLNHSIRIDHKLLVHSWTDPALNHTNCPDRSAFGIVRNKEGTEPTPQTTKNPTIPPTPNSIRPPPPRSSPFHLDQF